MPIERKDLDVLVDHLNSLPFGETLAWLKAALHGQVSLPRVTADEPPYLGVLRVEPALDKPTRRDLERGSRQLVHEFVRAGAGDSDYLNSLLHLAGCLELHEVASELAAMAQDFPKLPQLSVEQKRLVLKTLVDFKTPQPAEFWQGLLRQDAQAFAGTVLSGLLGRDRSSALAVLPQLPDQQPIADAASILLEQTAGQLMADDRARFIEHVRQTLRRCRPVMRASIEEWLVEIGEKDVVPARVRDLGLLDKALTRFLGNFIPEPASARLCPA